MLLSVGVMNNISKKILRYKVPYLNVDWAIDIDVRNILLLSTSKFKLFIIKDQCFTCFMV